MPTNLHVTPLYSALLALLLVGLSVRIIGMRRSSGVPLGNGADPVLERAMRAHGNFTEYVPIALLLMLAAELIGASAWVVHAAGMTLVAGRATHAWGVSRPAEDFRFRVAGMAATLSVLIGLALLLFTVWVVGR
jgi:uncharacterized membrane protein YecN with MAPEG domain